MMSTINLIVLKIFTIRWYRIIKHAITYRVTGRIEQWYEVEHYYYSGTFNNVV